jgi:predicted glycosyltransferase
MKLELEPLRIIVETVPHDVVNRLDDTDKQLRNELNALRGMFSQAMDVIGELKREIRDLKKKS